MNCRTCVSEKGGWGVGGEGCASMGPYEILHSHRRAGSVLGLEGSEGICPLTYLTMNQLARITNF